MIDDPEGPHAHHSKSGVAWLDLALALAVIVLSAASLITAQHTGKTMERLVAENSRLVRANSTPLLQIGSSNITGQSQRELTIVVSNVGTGTARVIWFELARKGAVPVRTARELIDYSPKAAENDYVAAQPVGGTYLPAGENRVILSWRVPTSPISYAKWGAFDQDRYGLVATACFCSVLGECWTSHLTADVPKPVAACDARGRVNFTGSG